MASGLTKFKRPAEYARVPRPPRPTAWHISPRSGRPERPLRVERGHVRFGWKADVSFSLNAFHEGHTSNCVFGVKPSITSRLLRQTTHHDTLPTVDGKAIIYSPKRARGEGEYKTRMSAADDSHQPGVRPLRCAGVEPRSRDPLKQHVGPEQCLVAIPSVDTEARAHEVWVWVNHGTTIDARRMSAMGGKRT